MASFTSQLFKGIINPVLNKAGLVKDDITASLKNSASQQKPAPQEGTMGALLRFLLINAASVIGAKLINDIAEKASTRLFQKNAAREAAAPDVPTLDTRTCPKCGAFRVRGEPCQCQA